MYSMVRTLLVLDNAPTDGGEQGIDEQFVTCPLTGVVERRLLQLWKLNASAKTTNEC
jgi:hypothetical protein